MEAKVGTMDRKDISEGSKWNLEGFYPTLSEWEAEFAGLQSRLSEYAGHRGKLTDSPDALKACLELDLDISRQLDRVIVYAHLRADEDKTHTESQGNFNRAMELATRLRAAKSFILPELMAAPQARIDEFLQSEALQGYRFYLELMLRFRDHTLSENEEALLANSLEIARASREAFDMLENADLDLGSIEDEYGQELQITRANYMSLMENYDRRVRRDAFETFYAAYETHKYTYSTLLAGTIKKDIFYSWTRKYASVREQALFDENIPVSVYDNLIASVHENLEPLYKYFYLRKRILGLEDLRVYDGMVPLVQDVYWNMTYEQAVDKTIDALQPLGPEYNSILRRGLLGDRWVDRYESKGKKAGAYSSGCYDSNPFILMNYRDDSINSLYTLAHEAGHSMHSYYSRKNQPFIYADYTIFVAEVASTFNEALVTRHLLNEDIDRNMRIYLICREIDNFRGTLYRQTMFAEFERQVFEAAESGKPVNLQSAMEIYRELLELYFGPGVVLDDALSLECFRIPHFYHSFYVYKYATGISAAYALADRVLNGGARELEDYMRFLGAGGSDYPINLLKNAGVDMTSPEPVRTALGKFAALVDELETLAA